MTEENNVHKNSAKEPEQVSGSREYPAAGDLRQLFIFHFPAQFVVLVNGVPIS